MLTLRGVSARRSAIGCWVLAGLVMIGSLAYGGWHDLDLAAGAGGLIASFGWVAFWRPRLEISNSGLRVVNLVRTFEIPWAGLAKTENRWGLYLYDRQGRKISVWAIPATIWKGIDKTLAEPKPKPTPKPGQEQGAKSASEPSREQHENLMVRPAQAVQLIEEHAPAKKPSRKTRVETGDDNVTKISYALSPAAALLAPLALVAIAVV